MLNCSNCRNGYLRIQRIGSSRRSRPGSEDVDGGDHGKDLDIRRESIMEQRLDTGGKGGRGAMGKQTEKGEENSSQIGISRRITPSKQILYVYIMQDNITHRYWELNDYHR